MAKKKEKSQRKQEVKPQKQEVLPGVQDSKIEALDDAAMQYVRVRDRRMTLTDEEVELKAKISQLMHANEKTIYRRGKISIELKPEGEKVKVRVEEEE